jgi:hypothetical protein
MALKWTACFGVVLLLSTSPPAEGRRQASLPSTDRLVSTTVAYVRDYQDAFRFLIADETSTQRVMSPPGPNGPSESRTTRGEVFITYLEMERQWTVVHDVAEVDGVPVPDREDLASLIREGTVSSVARRIFDRNARFNIGRVRRNFNDPMLALLPFGQERRARFSFSRRGVDRTARGETLVTLGFQERERPTIVRDVTGRSVFAKGEVVIDVTTGVVRRTNISFRHEDIDADLTTEFAFEDKLALWVPVMFSERYAASRNRQPDVTTSESRYSNYRRFEVTGRLR